MRCAPTRCLPVLAALAVCAGWSRPVAAQAVDAVAATRAVPSAVPDDVRAVSEFLLAAYPDLATQPTRLVVKRSAGQLIVSVRRADDGKASASGEAPPPRLLGAAFAFTAAGDLRSFAADGPLVDSTRNDVYREALSAHPAWTSGDAEVTLAAMGGRTRSAAGTIAAVDPARLAALIGTGALSTTLALSLPDAQTPARLASRPGWVSDVTTTGRDGKVATYRFEYEPFSGRLVAVTRR